MAAFASLSSTGAPKETLAQVSFDQNMLTGLGQLNASFSCLYYSVAAVAAKCKWGGVCTANTTKYVEGCNVKSRGHKVHVLLENSITR
jgi:hypothetical protein